MISGRLFCLFITLFSCGVSSPQTPEEKQVLRIVEDFFEALEKQDTAAFHTMFLKDARNYAVGEVSDSVVVRSQLSAGFRFNPKQIIRERMRKESTSVKIEGRIAMVWAPYDLWVNEAFSHCGVDVFTLIKTSNGWQIASISYTMEKKDCD